MHCMIIISAITVATAGFNLAKDTHEIFLGGDVLIIENPTNSRLDKMVTKLSTCLKM